MAMEKFAKKMVESIDEIDTAVQLINWLKRKKQHFNLHIYLKLPFHPTIVATLSTENNGDRTYSSRATDWLGQNNNPYQTTNGQHEHNVGLNNEVEQNGNSAWLSG